MATFFLAAAGVWHGLHLPSHPIIGDIRRVTASTDVDVVGLGEYQETRMTIRAGQGATFVAIPGESRGDPPHWILAELRCLIHDRPLHAENCAMHAGDGHDCDAQFYDELVSLETIISPFRQK